MAKKATTSKSAIRPIRLDQFQEQLEQVGISNLQEIQLSKDESVFIRLANSIDADDSEEFESRMRSAATSKDIALVVLDYYDGATADEQWEKFERAGGTADQLALIFRGATNDQAEKLGNLKPRRS